MADQQQSKRLGIMFKKLFDSIKFGTPSKHHNNLLSLAKVEYGRDWQWAYHELINGRTPGKGAN